MNGKTIRKYRMQCGLSQQQLADALDLPLEKILCWEKNLSQPSLDETQQLAQFFQTHIQDLSTQNEPSQRKKPLLIPILAISLVLILVCILLWQYIGRGPKNGNESLQYFTAANITVPTTTAPPATQASEPTAATQPTEHSMAPEEMVKVFSQSTVRITGTTDAGTRTGLGFFIDTKGTVLTTCQLVEGCHQIEIVDINGSKTVVDYIKSYNREHNFAVLATKRNYSTPPKRGNTSALLGDTVYTLNSFPVKESCLMECSITDGADSTQLLTVSVAISKEAVGGPLLDPYGKLVGITVSESGKAIPIEQIPSVNTGKISLADFFLETRAYVQGQYTPQWAGSFTSIGKLQEAQKRNPVTFEKPVTVSVTGVIVRTSKDELYLLPYRVNGNVSLQERHQERESYRLIYYHSDDPELIIANTDTKYRIYMKDDTANRALTGDVVTITGTYRHDLEIFTDCTYKYILTIP